MTNPQNVIETDGYAHCRGCGLDVIGEILCCYCEEARIANGMHDIPDLTQNELDTLACLSEESDEPEPIEPDDQAHNLDDAE